jgi:quinol monooxygenase YgiN
MRAITVSDDQHDDDHVERSGEPAVELTIVTLAFEAVPDAAAAEELAGVLARYVVLARREHGCRNVDLCASVTRPGRYLIVQKWSDPDAQRAHFDSDLMVGMARECSALLGAPPEIDLWDAASAHDLR